MILEHLDKNNLHHAYLIEGAREEIVPEILVFCENINIKTSGNPDFCHITIDNFKIDEAFDLRSMSTDKSFSEDLSVVGGVSNRKIFLVCVNSFTLEAQNVLLKMFEEPIKNTHFFLIVPDTNALLKTLVSRFYFISAKKNITEEKNAEKFIAMSLQNRIDFIKELLIKENEENEEGNEIMILDSNRSKALKFLNALEFILHRNFLKNYSRLLQPSAGTFPVQNSLENCLQHLFKVREFLRMPGSSTKSLLESVALITPHFSN